MSIIAAASRADANRQLQRRPARIKTDHNRVRTNAAARAGLNRSGRSLLEGPMSGLPIFPTSISGPPCSAVSYRELASKRVLGYVNWRRNRRKSADPGHVWLDRRGDSVPEKAVSSRGHRRPRQLALDVGIVELRALAGDAGRPEDVSVVPGNHDAYVPGAFNKVCELWAPWMRGRRSSRAAGAAQLSSSAGARQRGADRRFHRAGDGAVHGQRVFPRGTGGEAGKDPRRNGEAKPVSADHDPPPAGAGRRCRSTSACSAFPISTRRLIRHGADLVLHGHSHLPTLYWIGERKKPVPVVGVAAAGQGLGGHHPAAQYNLFEISGEPGHWHIGLIRRGLTAPGIISDVGTFDLGSPRKAPAPFEKATPPETTGSEVDQPVPEQHDRGNEPEQQPGKHDPQLGQEPPPDAFSRGRDLAWGPVRSAGRLKVLARAWMQVCRPA